MSIHTISGENITEKELRESIVDHLLIHYGGKVIANYKLTIEVQDDNVDIGGTIDAMISKGYESEYNMMRDTEKLWFLNKYKELYNEIAPGKIYSIDGVWYIRKFNRFNLATGSTYVMRRTDYLPYEMNHRYSMESRAEFIPQEGDSHNEIASKMSTYLERWYNCNEYHALDLTTFHDEVVYILHRQLIALDSSNAEKYDLLNPDYSRCIDPISIDDIEHEINKNIKLINEWIGNYTFFKFCFGEPKGKKDPKKSIMLSYHIS